MWALLQNINHKAQDFRPGHNTTKLVELQLKGHEKSYQELSFSTWLFLLKNGDH